MNTRIVILAAGRGSRLKTKRPKPLVNVLGLPMIQHLLNNLPPHIDYSIVINPNELSSFESIIGKHPYLFQKEPKGTAHALSSQYESLKQYDSILVLNADTPCVSRYIIEDLIHHSSKNVIIGFESQDTRQYGQILTHQNKAIKIVEQKDRDAHLSNLCFSGIMKLSQDNLKRLSTLPPSNITNEYYLTQLISANNPFSLLLYPKNYLHGINTFEELLHCEKYLKENLYAHFLEKNIHLEDYQSISFIQSHIGENTFIGKNAVLKDTHIGKNCHIGQGSILQNCNLEDNVTILPYSIITQSTIKQHAKIGPFAHIQENTHIGEHTQVGNFVEIKRSILSNNVKAKHLSYLGDTYIDNHANIGAGTITCNYVPWKKEKSMTYIGSYSLVGANCLLIAPCFIGDKSICAAGSVLQDLILPKQLAISRAPLSSRRSLLLR